MKKVLLSVAGFDPSSGAGVLLDVKVFEEFGFLGAGILTSLTAQNTKKISKVSYVPPAFIRAQYETLKEDMSIVGIKIGMIGSGKNIQVVDRILRESREIPVVVDPVFRSSSGTWLLEKKSISSYLRALRGKATLLTPNVSEASLISRIRIASSEKMREAAARIFSLIEIPCLIKGGSFGATMLDILYDGGEFFLYEAEKIEQDVHGTGCFLSSSLLCFLVQGNSLEAACRLATQLTHRVRERAIRVGRGQHLISFPFKRI